MARQKKVIDAEVETVVEAEDTIVTEKEAIVAWLRSGQLNMFERNTRWLADRIEAWDHWK